MHKQGSGKLLYYLYQPYKWLFLIPFIFLNTIVFMTVSFPVALTLGKKGIWKLIAIPWSNLNMAFVPIRVRTHGPPPDPSRSYVLVANHQSYVDIWALMGKAGISTTWVMKKELTKIPLFGQAVQFSGQIILDRSNKRAANRSIEEARKKIGPGDSVVFFPEGSRSLTGEMGKFKRGAFSFAQEMGLAVLPVTIKGSGKILPRDSWDLVPGRIDLIFHDPLLTNGEGREDIRALTKEAEDRVRSAMGDG